MKKFFVLACLVVFVASLSACGGKSADGIRAGEKKKGAVPLSERADESAQTEVY